MIISMSKVLKLTPHVEEKVWGGDRLKKIKNIQTDNPIGETWEVSTHPKGMSSVAKTPLEEVCHLNYLVKLIDTTDNLSVQVHPDDDYAKTHENDSGKTECWLILDAEPGAGIYLGFKDAVTKKEFKTALENKLPLEKFLNFVEVHPGDFFIVPAGTVHAIGSGVFLAESQQSSGITYRVWDWNRVGMDGKPRELHVDKSMDVLNFQEAFNQHVLSMKRTELFTSNDKQTDLLQHRDFNVSVVKLAEKDQLKIDQFASFLVVQGSVLLEGINFEQYSSGLFTVMDEIPTTGECVLLVTKPGN
jgi:mannose-6-phosphate isomerase